MSIFIFGFIVLAFYFIPKLETLKLPDADDVAHSGDFTMKRCHIFQWGNYGLQLRQSKCATNYFYLIGNDVAD